MYKSIVSYFIPFQEHRYRLRTLQEDFWDITNSKEYYVSLNISSNYVVDIVSINQCELNRCQIL